MSERLLLMGKTHVTVYILRPQGNGWVLGLPREPELNDGILSSEYGIQI